MKASSILVAFVALAFSTCAMAAAPQLPVVPPSVVPNSFIAGHFHLTDTKGQTVDSDALSGKPYGVFFGFTHCPDVCPTTMTDLSVALKRMPPAARDLKIYFISIDPMRDTQAVMAAYTADFDPRIVSLSGSQAEVDEAVGTFGIVVQRYALPHDDYAFGHSASIILVDGNGVLTGRVDATAGPDALAVELSRLVGAGHARPPASLE